MSSMNSNHTKDDDLNCTIWGFVVKSFSGSTKEVIAATATDSHWVIQP